MAKQEPWHRLPDETDTSWKAFTIYRDLGAARSFQNMLAEYTKGGTKATKQKNIKPPALTTVKKWSSRYTWRVRVVAFDAEQDRIAREAADKVSVRSAEEWAALRNKQREDELALGQQLIQRAKEMLDAPLFHREVKEVIEVNGEEVETVVHINPTDWKHRDIVPVTTLANKLTRLALGMDTDQIGVNSKEGDTDEAASDLRTLLEGEDSRAALITLARTLQNEED